MTCDLYVFITCIKIFSVTKRKLESDELMEAADKCEPTEKIQPDGKCELTDKNESIDKRKPADDELATCVTKLVEVVCEKEEEDEISLFCRTLGKRIRKLPTERQKALAMRSIDECIFKLTWDTDTDT